jgi:hypothetical protein
MMPLNTMPSARKNGPGEPARQTADPEKVGLAGLEREISELRARSTSGKKVTREKRVMRLKRHGRVVRNAQCLIYRSERNYRLARMSARLEVGAACQKALARI